MPDLLIELFSEEIPARMQARASADLRRLVTDGLVEAGLTYADAGAFATPRRLTLAIEGLTERSPDTTEERRGPKVGAPEKAVEGFARGAGVEVSDLEVRDDKKGQVYFATIRRQGRGVSEIVAEVLEGTIRGFPWPRSMRWGTGSLRWVRPLQRILCVLTRESGHEVVPLDVDGLTANAVTEGHRFMSPGEIRVTGFDDYATKLRRAHVILDSHARAERIRADADNLAFAAGLEVVEDEGLLAEVAGLVEWPVVLMGEIDTQFLDLPAEVLQTSMREHQKFFSVRDDAGRIVRFITVANRETADDGATILAGNRRVLTARLADAAFFWENDLKVAREGRMIPWAEALSSVTFHEKLGSEAERVERMARLARDIAPAVGAEPDAAEAAARLAKADLVSEMVYEFPELQGVMGRYYALEAGAPEAVARAVAEHYAPLGPSDDAPSAPVSVALALAEKVDRLAGFWSIDETPTGSKDPFALRRAGLGVIRIVLENDLRLPLRTVFQAGVRVQGDTALGVARRGAAQAAVKKLGAPDIGIDLLSVGRDTMPEEIARKLFPDADRTDLVAAAMEEVNAAEDALRGEIETKAEPIPARLVAFLHDRLKVHLRDEGLRHDVIDACLGEGSDDLALVVARARALQAFLGTDDGANLLGAFRRASNILRQAEEKDGVEYSFGADVRHAQTDEERALFAALDARAPEIEAALKAEDFAGAMSGLAALRAPLDAFFEAVQVNTELQIVRRNRLNLLSRIRALCLDVADLARIEG